MANTRRSPSLLDPPATLGEVLVRMRVGTLPGLYAFGGRHRLLSLYAQQVRALNLLHALEDAKRLGADDRLLVVGAGVAGLTLALAAAQRGVHAHVVDHALAPMGNLRHASHRYLHPNMLRWPDADWDLPQADLPVLPWVAGWADHVWAHLWASFEEGRERIESAGRTDLSVALAIQGLRIRPSGDRWEAAWKDDGLERPYLAYDAVVLAAGPGPESRDFQSVRYWDQEERALDVRAHTQAELISGDGDGGLIDAFRSALYDRHLHERASQLRLLALWREHVHEVDARLETSDPADSSRHPRLDAEAFARRAVGLRIAMGPNGGGFVGRETPLDLVVRRGSGQPVRLGFGACDVHRGVVATLILDGTVRITDDTKLPKLRWNAKHCRWHRPGEQPASGYHRVVVRHGPTLPRELFESFEAGSTRRRVVAGARALHGRRERGVPLRLFPAASWPTPDRPPCRDARVGWPHHAGDLYAALAVEDEARRDSTRPLEFPLLAALPGRATWLHARLGRRDLTSLRDRRSVAGVLGRAIAWLIPSAIPDVSPAGGTGGPGSAAWLHELERSGSLSTCGTLLPPAPGERRPVWAPGVGPLLYRWAAFAVGAAPDPIPRIRVRVAGARAFVAPEGARDEPLSLALPDPAGPGAQTAVLDVLLSYREADGEVSLSGVRLVLGRAQGISADLSLSSGERAADRLLVPRAVPLT